MHSRDASLAPELVILSQSQGEATTEEVMDWLRHEGVRHLRVNGEDFHGDADLSVRIGNGTPAARVWMSTEDGEVDISAASALWFRRWHTRNSFQHLISTALPAGDLAAGQQIYKFLSDELHALRLGLVELFGGARGLSTPDAPGHNKLTVLRLAAGLGLRVPETLITNSREELAQFMAEQGSVITKPISDCAPISTPAGAFVMFTSEVAPDVLSRLPIRFFTSLFQQKVEKVYELRTFYLEGRCWSMSIFSQSRAETGVDFRHDASARLTRHVPFALPDEVEERICVLMKALGLRTGSVDMIRTRDGEYVFLEINPVGQFGMVSAPCNYHLEHHVARFLRDLCRSEPAADAGRDASRRVARGRAYAGALLGDAPGREQDEPALGCERDVAKRGLVLPAFA